MNKNSDPRERPPDFVPKSEVADVLADVMEDQAEKKKARQSAPVPRPRSTGPLKLGALVFLTILSAFLWFGSPAWLDTSGSTPVPPELAEAGVRMEIYLQALRVDDFLAREGQLPNSLSEAGDDLTQVEYERLEGGGYRLSVMTDRGVLSYLSSEPLDLFLGDAMEVIGGRQ